MLKRIFLVASCCVAMLAPAGFTAAQPASYPLKPVRIIVPFPPEEFAAHLGSEYQKWGRVIKERGMRAE